MVLILKPVTYVQQIKDGCDYICSTSKYVKPIKYGLRIGKKGDKPNQKNTLNRTTENDIFNTRIEVNGSKRTFEQDIYKRALVQDIYNRTLVKDIHERTIEEDSYKGTFENRRKLKIVNYLHPSKRAKVILNLATVQDFETLLKGLGGVVGIGDASKMTSHRGHLIKSFPELSNSNENMFYLSNDLPSDGIKRHMSEPDIKFQSISTTNTAKHIVYNNVFLKISRVTIQKRFYHDLIHITSETR